MVFFRPPSYCFVSDGEGESSQTALRGCVHTKGDCLRFIDVGIPDVHSVIKDIKIYTRARAHTHTH